MRIAYVLTSLSVGGAERLVIGLAERMISRGHAVQLLVLRPRTTDTFPTRLDVTFLDTRKRPQSVLAAYIRARRCLRAFQSDLIHGHNFHGNLFARFLGRSFPQQQVISTIHNVYEGGVVRMAAYRWTDRFSSASVAVSQAVADRYVALNAFPRSRCQAIANGIDTALFAPSPERRKHTRARMGVANEFVWIAVGRLVPAKDYVNLLRAFACVREASSSSELWIAGDGESAYTAGLRKAADEYGVSQAVRWLGMCDDIPALLDAADAFVLASAWEGMPLALGEAMAMEKPAVATDVGGVRELSGDTAQIVPARNASELAHAMLCILRLSSAERRAWGKRGRERIVESFSLDHSADEWELLYRSLLGSAGSR